MRDRRRITLPGNHIDGESLSDLIEKSMVAIERRDAQLTFSCAKPHSLAVAQSDKAFRAALPDSDIVVPDGAGLTLMSRLVRIPSGPRTTGDDFFLWLMQAINSVGGRCAFFFGSSGKVLSLIRERMAGDFPNVELCGTLSPPFTEWSEQENEATVGTINAAEPDVLRVGMTAPKQEKRVYRNRLALNAPLIGSIGAVFELFAETNPRAPAWMCRVGLEWLYRLCREPRRMWRRHFISTPMFIACVLGRHLFGVPPPPWRQS